MGQVTRICPRCAAKLTKSGYTVEELDSAEMRACAFCASPNGTAQRLTKLRTRLRPRTGGGERMAASV